MLDAHTSKEGIEFLILPSPVTLDCKNFSVKVTFNKLLKFLKNSKNFRFVFKKIYPSKLAIIIDKTDIIVCLPTEVGAGPQTSEKINCNGLVEILVETG